jgi:hypothetical protein
MTAFSIYQSLTIIGSIIRNTMGWLSNHEAWTWRVPSDLVWAKIYCSRCETCTKPIPKELGFIFSARKEINENGYTIRELGDQDVIHNHKKIINHLDHTSRMLYIGPD